jgi:hypothetical protein
MDYFYSYINMEVYFFFATNMNLFLNLYGVNIFTHILIHGLFIIIYTGFIFSLFGRYLHVQLICIWLKKIQLMIFYRILYDKLIIS